MISSCSVDKFKSQLDKHLRNISDLPCQLGYNNSLDCLNGGQLRGCPGCQLDATEQDQVNQVSKLYLMNNSLELKYSK